MSTVFPIEWDDKENSPKLLAYLQQFGEKGYLTAQEINLIRDGLNELNERNVKSEFFLTKIFYNAFGFPGQGTDGWYSFTWGSGNNFFTANFYPWGHYGTGISPDLSANLQTTASLSFIPNKVLKEVHWNLDYVDPFSIRFCILKYDLISNGFGLVLSNRREILNAPLDVIANSNNNTQNTAPYTKGKALFQTSDIIDTPNNANSSVYFFFVKTILTSGSGMHNWYLKFE